MSTSNTTPGAAIIYTLFLLPDLVNPIAETSDPFFNNLQAGDYRVIATQILDGEDNMQQQDETIIDLVIALDFDVSHTTITDCDSEGTIVVAVLSGNAVLYEIISGPEAVSPQASNVFQNLQSGTYIIRVFDDCGNAVTKTYTMLLNINAIGISNVMLPVVYNSCDEVEVSHTISTLPNTTLIYPLMLTYIVSPPDGSPDMTFTQNVTSGPENQLIITQILPLFGADSYNFIVIISDNCGLMFEVNFSLNPNPKVELTEIEAFCGVFLNLNIENYLPPYTVNFVSTPAGFNPIDYNVDYPGPYTDSSILFSLDGVPVPIGTYNVSVLDACGRVGIAILEVEEVEVEPITSTSNTGCDVLSGFIGVIIPDREVISATIIDAPPAYTQTLPQNVDAFIENDALSIDDNLPHGDYILEVIDNCGVLYIIEATILEFEFQELNIFALPNCQDTSGSVSFSSNHESISSVIITAAPTTFTEGLPFDANANISTTGNFFVNNLPIGTYVFEVEDLCGFQYNPSVNITSYSSNPSAFILTRNCGSFDVSINDFDESVTNQTYWFQLYNPDTDSWVHPNTGVVYTEGQIPNATTAIQILNFETLFNIFLTGEFRLIKVFQSFNSENPDDLCLDIFANFSVFSDLVIAGIYNLDCTGGSDASDVIIDVIGVEPYNFSITSPFIIDNGTDNTFLNLAPGTYEIRVEDACGSIENSIINLENLLPLARVNMPEDILVCRADLLESDVFVLTNQDAIILGNQNPNNYNVTYHLSQVDANTGNNPLPDSYTNIINPQTIYARVFHDNLIVCYATTSFQIFVGQIPELSPEAISYICPESNVTLTADSGFDQYLWSTGETTQSIDIEQEGTYTVVITNSEQGLNCESTKQFIVNISETAVIEDIIITDWTANNNTITILTSGQGDYQYSLDDINFQSENTFTNLPTGIYTVFVKDNNGCDTATKEVVLLNYPLFFTPNGDTENEVWQIEFSFLEPELEVVIFDRYGKVITRFGSQESGWDGTYNGNNMPTNDYWFQVTRASGIVYTGHFTLKR